MPYQSGHLNQRKLLEPFSLGNCMNILVILVDHPGSNVQKGLGRWVTKLL